MVPYTLRVEYSETSLPFLLRLKLSAYSQTVRNLKFCEYACKKWTIKIQKLAQK